MAAIAVALVVLLVGGLFVFPWSVLRGPLTEAAGARIGRSVTVNDIDVRFGRVMRISLSGLKIANAPWGSEPTMLEASRIDIGLRLAPLLRGRMHFTELSFDHPKLLLEKKGQEGNWQFTPAKAAAEVAAPEERSEVPIIERLVINQGRVAYKDPGAEIDIDSQITTAMGETGNDRLQLEGRGTLEGKRLRVKADGDSILALRDEDKPYPLNVEIQLGETRVSAEGTLVEPVQLKGIDMRLDLSGPDMAALFPLFGIPLPATPDYKITGHLKREEKKWSVADLNGRVGSSDLRGDLAITTGDPRPKLMAELVSNRLDFKDLAGFIGGTPGEKDVTKAPGHVLPATPFNTERLRTMDMDVQFAGKRIQTHNLPLDDFSAYLRLDDGRLRVDPLKFGVADGTLGGTVHLDARRKIPAVEVDLQVSRIKLSSFFQNSRFLEEMGGVIGGRIELAGQGASTADLLAGADGRVSLFMGQGKLSNLVLELVGLDAAEALGFAVSQDKPVLLRCAIADFGVKGGLMQSRSLVIDTTDTVVTGDGQINLDNERLGLEVLAHPKDPSPLSARTPITIGGTFGEPKIGIDPKGAMARAGAAVALGALLTPLAALLPFVELGLGEDTPCGELIRDAQKDGPGRDQ